MFGVFRILFLLSLGQWSESALWDTIHEGGDGDAGAGGDRGSYAVEKRELLLIRYLTSGRARGRYNSICPLPRISSLHLFVGVPCIILPHLKLRYVLLSERSNQLFFP